MEKTNERRSQLQCTVHPLGSLAQYKYIVVCTRYENAWLLSKHKNRNTWETQGGHIEPGETPLDAARRELYEESGVREAELYPVCDYYGYDSESHANGMVFLAVVHRLGTLPASEMKETALFADIPDDLTYPNVSPQLYREAEKMLHTLERSGVAETPEETIYE